MVPKTTRSKIPSALFPLVVSYTEHTGKPVKTFNLAAVCDVTTRTIYSKLHESKTEGHFRKFWEGGAGKEGNDEVWDLFMEYANLCGYSINEFEMGKITSIDDTELLTKTIEAARARLSIESPRKLGGGLKKAKPDFIKTHPVYMLEDVKQLDQVGETRRIVEAITPTKRDNGYMSDSSDEWVEKPMSHRRRRQAKKVKEDAANKLIFREKTMVISAERMTPKRKDTAVDMSSSSGANTPTAIHAVLRDGLQDSNQQPFSVIDSGAQTDDTYHAEDHAIDGHFVDQASALEASIGYADDQQYQFADPEEIDRCNKAQMIASAQAYTHLHSNVETSFSNLASHQWGPGPEAGLSLNYVDEVDLIDLPSPMDVEYHVDRPASSDLHDQQLRDTQVAPLELGHVTVDRMSPPWTNQTVKLPQHSGLYETEPFPEYTLSPYVTAAGRNDTFEIASPSEVSDYTATPPTRPLTFPMSAPAFPVPSHLYYASTSPSWWVHHLPGPDTIEVDVSGLYPQAIMEAQALSEDIVYSLGAPYTPFVMPTINREEIPTGFADMPRLPNVCIPVESRQSWVRSVSKAISRNKYWLEKANYCDMGVVTTAGADFITLHKGVLEQCRLSSENLHAQLRSIMNAQGWADPWRTDPSTLFTDSVPSIGGFDPNRYRD